MTGLFILFLLFSYLCGSVPTGVFIARLFNTPDPRTQGSKNIGTTNMLRLGGKKAALLTLIGDGLKGAFPLLLAHLFTQPAAHLAWIAFFAFIGHLYPIFLCFRGGKGIATTLGALLALSYPLGLAVLFTWLVVAFLFRFSSLAALVSAALMPVYAAFFLGSSVIAPLFLMTLLIFYKHRSNLHRLYHGQEPKIGKKSN